MAILSTLARFSSHVMGQITKPEYFFKCCSFLFLSFSCRLKYIPYSDKIHVVLPIFNTEMERKLRGMVWNKYLSDNEARILDPADPGVERVLRVFVKIIQALSDGLRLKRDCRVYANCNVPKRMLPEKQNGIVVPSRFGSKEIVSRGRSDSPMKFLGMKYDTEHLEGLNWEVMVVESDEEEYATYYGNGKIVLYDGMLFSSDEKLAKTLAHEVGHEVAMHLEGHPCKALCFFSLIPWPSVFWRRAMLIRLWEVIFYCARRYELEADYIGLMLMAAAGYDPRVAPQFYKKDESYEDESNDFLLETSHPSNELRAQRLSQKHVMDRAMKIYEQVQAGQEVPSVI